MNWMTIIIVLTGLSLFALFLWMVSLSAKNKQLAAEKQARDRAYRKAIERQREEERKERQFKAETGHVPTQLYLAKEAEINNPKEALYWYEQAALSGNEMGMYGVLRVCERAKEDVVLSEKAKFWRLAVEAHNGNNEAKFEMGKAMLGGKGVEQDIVKGLSAIEEVANEGHIMAQIFMGDWYIADANMEPNAKLSAEWHYKAAAQGNAEAQIKLADHYKNGVGVKKNMTRATYWYEVAGEKGNAEAQFYAGEIWIGRGSKGNAIAYLWLFLSAHFGYEPARLKRDDVGNLLGVDAVVALQEMAKPLLRKLADGAIIKHSMIKALNTLYKREEYFPNIDGNEFMIPSEEQSERSYEEEQNAAETTPELDFSLPYTAKSE